ncbi:hypothetical protein GCM10010357_56920 [Streptomyces luteireticuli]|uniref:Uncharacterized protein n=1 Tax=Streptomyces luteireticuli TaxID=173858 RepID=A0ABN0Z0T1_9ACTN
MKRRRPGGQPVAAVGSGGTVDMGGMPLTVLRLRAACARLLGWVVMPVPDLVTIRDTVRRALQERPEWNCVLDRACSELEGGVLGRRIYAEARPHVSAPRRLPRRMVNSVLADGA